jgi:hypothetical protein
LTHSGPAAFSVGGKFRRQQLSFDNGVVSFSEGKTHAAGRVSIETALHSSIAARKPSEIAAPRTE